MIPRGMALPFVLVTVLFFLWGIPNNLNDVLIRQFMKSFEISRFQAGLVQSAFYLGYFLFAMRPRFLCGATDISLASSRDFCCLARERYCSGRQACGTVRLLSCRTVCSRKRPGVS
jgi:hypothetical protein